MPRPAFLAREAARAYGYMLRRRLEGTLRPAAMAEFQRVTSRRLVCAQLYDGAGGAVVLEALRWLKAKEANEDQRS